MFLLFKSLSRFVIVSNKEQISFHFMTAVTVCSDLEPKKKNSIAISIFSHSIYHEVMGLNAVILVTFDCRKHKCSLLEKYGINERLRRPEI